MKPVPAAAASLPVIVLILGAVPVIGCERRVPVELPGDVAPAAVPDPAAAPAVPVQAPSMPPVSVPAPAGDAAPAAIIRDVASSTDLAQLSAALGVPVAGVTRAQLRDTYLESRGERLHHAIDILAPRNTAVLSAADGTLLRLFDSRAGGLMIYTADVTGRFILYYGHLDSYAAGLTDGMALTRGQVIGYVGTTGNAPPGTPHLHFGILRGDPQVSWSEGTPVNPFPLLTRLRP